MNSRNDRAGLVAIMAAAVAMTIGGVAFAMTDAGVHGPPSGELPLIVQSAPKSSPMTHDSTRTDAGGDTDHEVVSASIRESDSGDGDLDGQSEDFETTSTVTGH